ncbi:MAG: hypothetical protein ACM3JB_26180 [Acidobacteriaceae bacterium]
MPGTAKGVCTRGKGGRAMLAVASGQTAIAAGRISATDKLMAAPCRIVLPSLAVVPTEHRFSADDREVIALAEILVNAISRQGRTGRRVNAM